MAKHWMLAWFFRGSKNPIFYDFLGGDLDPLSPLWTRPCGWCTYMMVGAILDLMNLVADVPWSWISIYVKIALVILIGRIKDIWNSKYSNTCVKRPPKIDKTKILMTIGSLMKVKSIAECSKRSILQYFWPALRDNWSWKAIFPSFWEWPFYSGFTVLTLWLLIATKWSLLQVVCWSF